MAGLTNLKLLTDFFNKIAPKPTFHDMRRYLTCCGNADFCLSIPGIARAALD
jgi:hypothetical protein